MFYYQFDKEYSKECAMFIKNTISGTYKIKNMIYCKIIRHYNV